MPRDHAAVAGRLPTEEAERALDGLTRLDLPPWHWPGHPARWYAGEEAVAFVSPNRGPEPDAEPAVSVWVSATSDDALRFLEPHVSAAWDYLLLAARRLVHGWRRGESNPHFRYAKPACSHYHYAPGKLAPQDRRRATPAAVAALMSTVSRTSSA